MKKYLPISFAIILCILLFAFGSIARQYANGQQTIASQTETAPPKTDNFPFSWLFIPALEHRSYPGSKITTSQTLPEGENYHEYKASYFSDGLKINALLTIPKGNKPNNGWPVIVFNHGYIPPKDYDTVTSYQQYVDALANNGFIVFKPDYRGNGDSQGTPAQSYIAPAYIIDDMNAIASIKQFKDANPNAIGVWAHSMGGNITLYDLILSKDIKAAAIWSGVVGSYGEILDWWEKRSMTTPQDSNETKTTEMIKVILKFLGTPDKNPFIWQFIDPSANLKKVTAPVQLQVGLDDHTLPWQFSKSLADRLQKAQKTVTYYAYAGEDHGINGKHFPQAMQRSIDFFNKYLKKK